MISTRGIVLRTVRYSETSIIADIYTEARGMQSYYLPGVRSEKARIKAGLFQVMTVLEMVASARDDKHLQRIAEVRPALFYTSIPFEVRKGAIALFLAEIVRKTVREIEPNPPLFAFLLENLAFLDAAARFSNLHLHFLVHFSAFLGILPGGDCTPETPCFDLKEGLFVPLQSPVPRLLGPMPSALLYQLLETGLPEAQDIPMGKSERNGLLAALIEYYRLQLDYLPDIQSHLILQEAFN
jgi:DNA repair protein RecO (recombination protein O)